MSFSKEEVKNIVKESYSSIAKSEKKCGCSCGKSYESEIAKSIGYSEEELKVPGNLGLGCGNPLALGRLNLGEIVVDLGSGGGFDCFIASRKVGKSGKVIGIDMSEDMVELARKNALKNNYENVEFRLGDIEDLPLESNSADVIISNCVINLAPDKKKVFEEAHRVLKKGGRIYLSDIVLLKPLSDVQKEDKGLLAGCVSGALLKDSYISILGSAGFKIHILAEDKEISKKQYRGIALESLKLEAIKI